MNKLVWSLIFLVICNTAHAQNLKSDFIDIHWGMKYDSVIIVEKSKLLDINGSVFSSEMKYLTFTGDTTIYEFVDNKLIRILYMYAFDTSCSQTHIEKYYKKIYNLNKNYGKPDKSELIWSLGELSPIAREEFKNQKDTWHFALDLGILTFKTTWKTESSIMVLALFNTDNRLNFGMICEDNIVVKYNEDEIKENNNQNSKHPETIQNKFIDLYRK